MAGEISDVVRSAPKAAQSLDASPVADMAATASAFSDYVLAKPGHATFPKPEAPTYFRADARESLSVEHRSMLIDKLNLALESQKFHGEVQTAGASLAILGFTMAKRRPEIAGALQLVGLGTGLVSAINSGLAGGAAADVLKSMPKADAARFGKYKSEMNSAQDTVLGGYGLAVGAAFLSEKIPSKSPAIVASAVTLAQGFDYFTNFYTKRNTLNNFQTDFAAWKREMQKT